MDVDHYSKNKLNTTIETSSVGPGCTGRTTRVEQTKLELDVLWDFFLSIGPLKFEYILYQVTSVNC